MVTYSAHSTHMAAPSNPVLTVIEAACWTSAGTFQKFYHRAMTNFADSVLSSKEQYQIGLSYHISHASVDY